MVEASCFQASRVGAEGTAARLGVGPSREDTVAEVMGGAGGDEGAKEGLVSAAEAGKEASALPFAAPPSVRKWKLQEAEWGSQVGSEGPWAGQPSPAGQAWAWRAGLSTSEAQSPSVPISPPVPVAASREGLSGSCALQC